MLPYVVEMLISKPTLLITFSISKLSEINLVKVNLPKLDEKRLSLGMTLFKRNRTFNIQLILLF